MTSEEYYDYDELDPTQSPGLRPVIINYAKHEDTPPPDVPESSASPSPEPEEAAGTTGEEAQATSSRPRMSHKRKRRKRPNYPDVADQAANKPLSSDSGEDDSEGDVMSDVELETNGAEQAGTAQRALELIAQKGEGMNGDFEMIDRSVDFQVKEELPSNPPVTNGVYHANEQPSTESQSPPASQLAPPRTPLDLKPPPLVPRIDTSRSRTYDEHDSLLKSPALGRFAISSADGNPDSTLPAMQMSPPRSSSGQSPESMPTLPSLHTALSLDSASSNGGPFSLPGHSPTRTRPSPGQMPQYGPSPSSYSHPSPAMSPPSGLPTHSGYWRANKREGSFSTTTPSDYTQSISTPSSIPTPATTTSSASYPTSTTHHHHSLSVSETTTSLSTTTIKADQQSNGTSPTDVSSQVPLVPPPNAYKCSFPTCTAPPFQTQYLLNSHANVHSSSRPHFCPVKGCNRGPGGRGFKRKNEMIRHGLVHDSPGYTCPFCPDQQHKYPRPDNLQRHVRVHHVDKDRDDPLLRDVLAARPEGGSRGRMRRVRGGSLGEGFGGAGRPIIGEDGR